MILIKNLHLKELFLQVKTNFPNKLSIFLLSLGIFCLGFSKSIWLGNPTFYFGKFNYYQNLQISLSTIFIILGSITYLIDKKSNFKLNKYTLISILFLIIAIYRKDNNIFNYIAALLLIQISSQFSKKELKIFLTSFIYSIVLQILIATFQIINFSNTKISLLSFLGEPEISKNLKNITKIDINNFKILRPYGTTYHPNFLAGLILIGIYYNQIIKQKILEISLFLTLSVSSLVGYTIMIFQNKNIKKLIIIGIITLLILSLKLNSFQYLGMSERYIQINEYIKSLANISFSQILIGTGESIQVFLNIKQLPWELQPIHNHFIFAFQKYGLLGILIVYLTIKKLYIYNKNLFYIILPILMFDHYFFSLANGIILYILICFVFKEINPTSQKVTN